MSKEGQSAAELVPAKPAEAPANGTTALAPVGQRFGLTIDRNGNLDLPSLGVVLQQSGFFSDIQRASQGMVKVMLGRELGIPAITAVVGIHILTNTNGKVTVMIGSHLKAGKIKKSGVYDYDVDESTDKVCRLIPKIKNPETGKWEAKKPVVFTIEQAQKMKVGGYGKDGPHFKSDSNWAKAAEDMLFHRCMGRMEKMHFPDISTVPTYTPDELGFREDEHGEAVMVEGALVRDEDGAKVNSTQAAADAEPEATTAAAPPARRIKANQTMVAKLQALSKKHKWENGQFFEMLIAEGGTVDKEAAQIVLEQQNWKALTELIAGEDDVTEKIIVKLAMGPDVYLDAKNNPPEGDAK